MRKQLLSFGLLWLVFSLATPAWAEVRVSARVERTALTAGESLQLEVRVSGGEGVVDISPITDFKVHSRSTSSSVQIINGRMTKEVVYNYVLVHRRQGKLTIPPLAVTVDGQPHRTEPITVTVTKPPPTAANPSQERDVWVTAELSEISPFTGQEIIYTFRLYRAVRIDNARFQAPGFSGFSAKEVEDRRSYRKVINGREHVVTEVYFILTPLSPGSLTLDPAVLHVGVVRENRSKRRSPFDDFFNRSVVEPRVLQTEALKIEIRALPSLPPPLKFSGLVGRFRLSTQMESTDLKVGDSATLTITLEGRGNIMDARLPDLKLPSAFKSYADNPEEEIQADRHGTRGKKVFRTALVPVNPGEYSLPSVDLVYFDFQKEAYQTLKVEIPALTVLMPDTDQPGPLVVTPGPGLLAKKKVAFTGRDILPPKESLAAIQPRSVMGWPLFLLALVGPAVAFMLATLVQRMRRPDTSAGALMKSKARRALKRATHQSGEECLTSLYQALIATISGAAGRTGEALTWKEAEALLLENQISAADAASAARLLSDIESFKFSGADLDAEQTRKLLDETRKMVRKLAP